MPQDQQHPLTPDSMQHEFQNLVNSPAWELLVKVALAQIRMRETNGRKSPITSQEDVYRRERLMGEADGMEILIRYPMEFIQDARTMREMEQVAGKSEVREDYEDFMGQYETAE